MNQPVAQSTAKRALSVHSAIGMLCAALLYLVCVSGTLAVFQEELQLAEQPDAPRMHSIDADAVQAGMEALLAREADGPTTTHLTVRMPAETRPLATVWSDTQAFHLNPAGALAQSEEKSWSSFVLALHYMLNLPGLIGLTFVGLLGVMMLVLILSGVIAHPRIFRDAFRLRAKHGGGLALADWHNRLSVWTLPFSTAIALTGAVLALASLVFGLVAQDSYGGDMEAAYAPIYGEEGPLDPAPAPLPDIPSMLQYMEQNYPDVTLTYVVVHDPLARGQHVQIVGLPEKELIFGEYYPFNSDGNFLGPVGLADGDWGQQAAASNYNLHFGSFAGLPGKIAYLVLGAILSAICATGVYIWLGKRQRKGLVEPRLRAVWNGIVWGVPLLLGLTFVARLLFGNSVSFAAVFWLALIGCILPAILMKPRSRLVLPLQIGLPVILTLAMSAGFAA